MAIVAAAGLLLALFVLGIDIVLAAFGGILLAVLLRALTDFVTHHTPLSDGVALTSVILLIATVLVAGGWLLAPGIEGQLREVGERLPEIARELEQRVRGGPAGEAVEERMEDGSFAEWVDGAAEGILSALPRGLSSLLTAFFVGLFGAVNPTLYHEATAHLFPLRHRTRVRELLDELGHTLRWWLIGQAFSMLLIGSSVAVLLWAFDVPLALPLGIIVGLLGFIPYLGPILGAVPVALVAATAGTSTFLGVMLGYVIVQNLEGYVALPLIHQRTVYLPPAFTIVVQIVMGTVIGITGFVMATPVAVVALVLTRFYREHVLGDPEAVDSGR